jgi:hypothetical protein
MSSSPKKHGYEFAELWVVQHARLDIKGLQLQYNVATHSTLTFSLCREKTFW